MSSSTPSTPTFTDPLRSLGALPDGFEDALNQLELVRGKRVIADEVICVSVLSKGHAAVAKCELAFEDVPAFAKDVIQFRSGGWDFCKEASLDDLVNIGTGQ